MEPSPSQQHHWRKTLWLTGGLLLVWGFVTFGVAFFARSLNFRFFGWPFSYWVAAQGALVVYVLLVALYARSMERMDQAHGLDEEPADA